MLSILGLALGPAAIAGHSAPHPAAETTYTVRPGDTLSGITARIYAGSPDWQWLWQANKGSIADPNMIIVGERLTLPAGPPVPVHIPLPRVAPDNLPPAPAPSPTPNLPPTPPAPAPPAPAPPSPASAVLMETSGGTYGCAGLEALWDQAGGNPGVAVTAASIAMAESGGNPNAISPTDDFGLWQINGSHGSMATLNPAGNARSAVSISNDGRNWGPWTTYTSGAYRGKC
jgi:LysM repeat protein